MTARIPAAALVAAVQLALVCSAAAAPTTAPANIKVSGITTTQMSVTWDAPTEPGVSSAEAGAYHVIRTPTSVRSDRTAQTLTSAAFAHLACGTAYRIVVSFNDGTGRSPDGETTATTAPCTKPAPAAPTGLGAEPLAANSIRFSWSSATDVGATHMAHETTGPLLRESMPRRADPGTSAIADALVCGQSYTFSIWWINDEGRASDPASTSATTLGCSTVDTQRPGPSDLKITRVDLNGFSVEFDPRPTDVNGYRISASGRDVNVSAYSGTFFVGNTFAYTEVPPVCGETYTISVQWVFADGGISLPTSVNGSLPACVAPKPAVPAPPPLPAIVPDTTPPVITLGTRRLRVNKKGVIALPLTCGPREDHCSGTLTLMRGKAPKRLRTPSVVGKISFRIGAGRSRAFKIKLRRPALAALRKARRLSLVLVIAGRDDSGNRVVRRVQVRALAPTRS